MSLPLRSNGEEILASFFNDIKTELEGNTNTTSNDFAIGDGTTGTNKTITAQNGETNEPHLQYNETDNRWQFSNDGVTYSNLGSGVGGRNYIEDNPDAESSLDGWTESDATNFALSRNTTTPLRGDADFKVIKAASDQSGDYIAYDFDLDNADIASKLLISIDFDASDASYVDDDIAIKLYDKDTSAYIDGSTFELKGGKGTFYNSVQTHATSTNYELRLFVNNTSTNGYTIYFDNVNVGPQAVSYGVPATDIKSFTPTGSWVTNTTYTGTYSRIGDKANIDIYVETSGAPTAASLTLDISDIGVIDTSKLSGGTSVSQILGIGFTFESGVQNIALVADYATSTTVGLKYPFDSIAASTNPVNLATLSNTGPFTFGAGDKIHVQLYNIPIVSWSSNVEVSSDLGNRDIVVLARSNSNDVIGANTAIPFITVGKDTSGSWSGTVFTAQESGTYSVDVIMHMVAKADYWGIWVDGSTDGWVGRTLSSDIVNGSKTLYLTKGQTLSVRLNSSTTLVTGNNHRIMITKLATPQTFFSDNVTIRARYGSTDQPEVNSADSTKVYNTLFYDDLNAYDTSTGEFTVPSSGVYSIKGYMRTESESWLAGSVIAIYIGVNGARAGRAGVKEFDAAITGYRATNFVGEVEVDAGDTIEIRMSSTVTTNLRSSTEDNWFAIHKVN